MNRFIKREQANKPVKLPLYSEGKDEFFLMVVSAYSDHYKIRKASVFRTAAQSATDGKFTDEIQLELTAKLAASTIVDWHLPKEIGNYSPEAAEQLLLDYPQILEAVDAFSSKNENFIAKKLKA